MAIYTSLESYARSLGPIELVARDRYVLMRTVRIFADLVIMAEAVRVAVHLGRQVDDPMFFKVVADRRHVTHVTKLETMEQLERLKPFLEEAYRYSIA